jgi:TolA-binding protein
VSTITPKTSPTDFPQSTLSALLVLAALLGILPTLPVAAQQTPNGFAPPREPVKAIRVNADGSPTDPTANQKIPKASPVGAPIPKATPLNPSSTPAPAPLPTPPSQPPLAPVNPVPTTLTRPTAETLAIAKPNTQKQFLKPSPSKPVPAKPSPQDPPPSPNTPGTSSEEDLAFNVAEALYARNQLEEAKTELQAFASKFPQSPNLPLALFHLAEAYRRTDLNNSALLYYKKYLEASKSEGPFAGPAAFRLAEAAHESGNSADAITYFQTAAKHLTDPNILLVIKFYSAKSLQNLNRRAEARAAYQELADATEPHQFRDECRHTLALLLKENGKDQDAIARMKELASGKNAASDENLAARSAAMAGLWLSDANKVDEATPLLEIAVKSPHTQEWRDILHLALMRGDFFKEKFDAVLSRYKQIENSIDAAKIPQSLVLVANAYRQLNKHAEALAVYDRIIRSAPETPAAKEAAFERLRCLYRTDNPKTAEEIDAFLATHRDQNNRLTALRMKAEFLRAKDDFATALTAYRDIIKINMLKGDELGDALIRLADCARRTNNHEEVISATRSLINSQPQHRLVLNALIWNAEALQRTGKKVEAEKTYTLLIEKHPKAEERESAIRLLALMRGESDDLKGMVKWYDTLLKEYPKSAFAGEAHHHIGSTAFQSKDYKTAATHLAKSRELNGDRFFEEDSMQLMLCAYYQEDTTTTLQRINDYQAKGKGKVPSDVLRWIASKFFDQKNFKDAQKSLELLSKNEDVRPADWYFLAQAQVETGDNRPAVQSIEHFLQETQEPPVRAKGLLIKGRALVGAADEDAARKTLDEAIRLQAEGPLNGEARILLGDLELAKGNPDAAAKAYMTVAVVLDDEAVTPKALEKALGAYQKSGKTKEAADTLNRLRTKYPEYAQQRNLR